MGFESFGTGQRGDGGREVAQSRAGQLLHGDDLDVIGGGQAAAHARRAAGRQNVIGAGGVIAGGFGTEGSDEDAAGMADLLEQRFVGDAEMLGRESVG